MRGKVNRMASYGMGVGKKGPYSSTNPLSGTPSLGAGKAILIPNLFIRLDKNDHDVLASLQLVAQAFEIWFMMIATALLYDVAMIFAGSPSGLYAGYLSTYLEFSDVKNPANPLLWTSAFPSRHSSQADRKRHGVTKLILFALLAAFLTILANLMGAGTAVLPLPSLQWVELERVPQQRQDGLALSQPPHGDVVFAGRCNNAQLETGNSSCTTNVYRAKPRRRGSDGAIIK